MSIHCKYLPTTGNAAQLHQTPFVEAGTRTDYEVTNRSRDEDVARAGVTEDPCHDVYSDPSDIGLHQFTLAGVDADADFDAEILSIVTKGFRAPNSLRRPPERDQVTVIGAFH